MSRLFNDFIEKVFTGNPHAYDNDLAMQVDSEHEEWSTERQKWIDGKITLFNGGTVEQWVALGRPKNKTLKI